MKPISILIFAFSLALIFSSCSPSIEKSTKTYFYKHRKESDQLFELSKGLIHSSQYSFSLERNGFTSDSVVTFFFWENTETKENYWETTFSIKIPFSIKNNIANSDTFLVNHHYFTGKEKMKLLATTFFYSRYQLLNAYKDDGVFLGFKDNPDFVRSPEMIGIFYSISTATDMKHSKKLEENIYLHYLGMGA